MNPDQLAAALADQIRSKVDADTAAARNAALRQIAAAGASATASAKNAVIASGLIGGILGGVLVYYFTRK